MGRGSGRIGRAVRIRLIPYPPYRASLGPGPIELEMPEGSTLRDALRQLAAGSRDVASLAEARSDEWLWGQLIAHRRGEMVRLDEPLGDGDTLELLPPIAGGAPREPRLSPPPARRSAPSAYSQSEI